jgi:hypothetical protein
MRRAVLNADACGLIRPAQTYVSNNPMCLAKHITVISLSLSLLGCASTGDKSGDDYSSINGGDSVEEVRPDIFFIISKSGFDGQNSPMFLIDKLIYKSTGQGSVVAIERWQIRANELCGSSGYRIYKPASFSQPAGIGYPYYSIAVKSAYAVCNRKKYSEADIKTMFPDW